MDIEFSKNPKDECRDAYYLDTDFPITQTMLDLALSTRGVYSAILKHKYCAKILISQMFDRKSVMDNVIAAISAEALKTSQEVDDNAFIGGLPAIFPEERPALQEVDDNAIFASPAALPEERSALQEVDDNAFIDSPLSGQQVKEGEVDWQARVW